MLQGLSRYIFSFQVESRPNTETMLAAARGLRTEKDRKVEIQNQKQEQRNLVGHYKLFKLHKNYVKTINNLFMAVKCVTAKERSYL